MDSGLPRVRELDGKSAQVPNLPAHPARTVAMTATAMGISGASGKHVSHGSGRRGVAGRKSVTGQVSDLTGDR